MSPLSVDESAPLAAGVQAPDFNLNACNAQAPIGLSQYRGRSLILVFYPKDQTPGCTRQLCALQEDLAALETLGAAVIASNPASVESHQRFADKQGYRFPILSDPDKRMAQAYHALKENGGVQRTVYIIDPHGAIRYGKQGMPSVEELKDALSAMAALSSSP